MGQAWAFDSPPKERLRIHNYTWILFFFLVKIILWIQNFRFKKLYEVIQIEL